MTEKQLMPKAKQAFITPVKDEMTVRWPSDKDLTEWIYNLRKQMRKSKDNPKLTRILQDLIIIKQIKL